MSIANRERDKHLKIVGPNNERENNEREKEYLTPAVGKDKLVSTRTTRTIKAA